MARGSSIVDQWIEEGEARGEARGEALGKTAEARQMALRVMSGRFGPLPERLVARIRKAGARTCERLVDRALEANSLTDVDWQVELEKA